MSRKKKFLRKAALRRMKPEGLGEKYLMKRNAKLITRDKT